MNALLNELLCGGPKTFTSSRLAREPRLFSQRAACIYTPTTHVPADLVGSGRLDVWLPLPVPTFQESIDNPAYRYPRLWVDLLQRATGCIRWIPMVPARVTVVRFDDAEHPDGDLSVKQLIDALKVSTTGRPDGRLLHYFGAIRDDCPADLPEFHLLQESVRSAANGGTRVVVDSASRTIEKSLPPEILRLLSSA